MGPCVRAAVIPSGTVLREELPAWRRRGAVPGTTVLKSRHIHVILLLRQRSLRRQPDCFRRDRKT